VADYEIVQNYTGAPFTLAAHAANIALPGPATTWPQVRLKDDPMANQDGCKNATVVLEYGGTAGPVS
jgi:hypothetical protein